MKSTFVVFSDGPAADWACRANKTEVEVLQLVGDKFALVGTVRAVDTGFIWPEYHFNFDREVPKVAADRALDMALDLLSI